MFRQNGNNEEVIKLAKALVDGHREPVDMAYLLAYRFVMGKYAQKMPSSMENKIWRCSDYRQVSPDEYRVIKSVYQSNRV